MHALIQRIAPHVIVHAAGVHFTASARNPHIALEVNTTGTRNVARAAQEAGSRLIYLSTDMVHNGIQGFYSELDSVHPICHYGKTKLEGEYAVSALCSDYCIARLSLVYGISRNVSRCVTEVMVEMLREGKTVRLFRDEYRCPVYAECVADVLMEIADRSELKGLFHICGPDRISRLELGLRIADVYGLDSRLILPMNMHECTLDDRRPKDCSMNNAKIASVLKTRIFGIDEGLEKMRQLLTIMGTKK